MCGFRRPVGEELLASIWTSGLTPNVTFGSVKMFSVNIDVSITPLFRQAGSNVACPGIQLFNTDKARYPAAETR
jgi:hypothetical protein